MNRTNQVRPFKLALLASFALAVIAANSSALAASATASASATVIVPISVTSTANLSFGKFAAGSGGTVTISTSGARTGSGVVLASGGTASAAAFDITGEPNAGYSIDTSATTATLTSGSDTMALAIVSDFTGGNATSGTQATGTLDGTGKQTLHVGGVLTVGASQNNGSYTGTVSVAVAYN